MTLYSSFVYQVLFCCSKNAIRASTFSYFFSGKVTGITVD